MEPKFKVTVIDGKTKSYVMADIDTPENAISLAKRQLDSCLKFRSGGSRIIISVGRFFNAKAKSAKAGK